MYSYSGNSVKAVLDKFTKTRDQIPHAKHIDENQMTFVQTVKITWFMMTHNQVAKHYNFTDDVIAKLRKKHGTF